MPHLSLFFTLTSIVFYRHHCILTILHLCLLILLLLNIFFLFLFLLYSLLRFLYSYFLSLFIAPRASSLELLEGALRQGELSFFPKLSADVHVLVDTVNHEKTQVYIQGKFDDFNRTTRRRAEEKINETRLNFASKTVHRDWYSNNLDLYWISKLKLITTY